MFKHRTITISTAYFSLQAVDKWQSNGSDYFQQMRHFLVFRKCKYTKHFAIFIGNIRYENNNTHTRNA